MLIQVIKSKIHRVTVTQAELNYIGSITIDRELMDASGIVEGERVFIVDINNGERFDTYVIAGEPRSGVICLNGAAARRVLPGDVVIIMAYALVTPEEARTFRPRVIFPDTATNRLPEQPQNNE
ncbi:MAG TPA: aspartate 1-decarboxylase [Porphyromonadaceae bacterium]|nr:aspartate 1-decarboxylase [Porphyromonadaceae bacterium]